MLIKSAPVSPIALVFANVTPLQASVDVASRRVHPRYGKLCRIIDLRARRQAHAWQPDQGGASCVARSLLPGSRRAPRRTAACWFSPRFFLGFFPAESFNEWAGP
jgi:hypothetical protein